MNYQELGFITETLLKMYERKKTTEKVVVELLQEKMVELKSNS